MADVRWWSVERGCNVAMRLLILGGMVLGGCSSDSGHAADGSGGSAPGGGSGHVGGSSVEGKPGAPSAGASGTSSGTAPPRLHLTWSTWQLSGTTLTPITCAMLGIDTVGFSFNGSTLETQQNSYSQNDSDCASGERELEWTFGPGNFYLRYGLYPNTFDTARPILWVSVPFTVTATSTVVEVSGKMIFVRYPLTWTIQKAGNPATCADVGATTVDVVLEQGSDSFSSTLTFPKNCEPTSAMSPPLQPGTYALSAQLLASGVQLANWSTATPLIVTAENAPEFPPIMFAVP